MDTDGEKIAAGERGRRAQKREENRLAWIDHPNLMAENHPRKREENRPRKAIEITNGNPQLEKEVS